MVRIGIKTLKNDIEKNYILSFDSFTMDLLSNYIDKVSENSYKNTIQNLEKFGQYVEKLPYDLDSIYIVDFNDFKIYLYNSNETIRENIYKLNLDISNYGKTTSNNN